MAGTTYNGPFLPPIRISSAPLLSSPTDTITSQELHSALDRDLSDSFESLQVLYQVQEEEREEDWSEESDQFEEYRGTKPLSVRKKKGRSVKVVHTANRRRSTIVSAPRSPLSLKLPPSPRSPASSNSDSTHAHMSRMFLSLPELSPSPTMAPPSLYQPDRPLPVVSRDRQSKRSSRSSLHLGLGGSSSYDPICPGPSPPSSPAPSPNKRHFARRPPAARYDSLERPRKPLPTVPSSPMTPSRAPRKAAKLLGVGFSPVMGLEKKKNYAASALKAGKHFRPLPNMALTEIENFFGEVPRKPSKSHPGLKAGKKTGYSLSHNGNSAHGAPESCDRNVGEGQTVKHRGEDGSMWLDVEEEQEFAWLMGKAIATVPAPLPSVQDLSESMDEASPVAGLQNRRRDRCMDDMSTLYGSDEEEDRGKWGMEAFTSILSVPKPKIGRASPSSTFSASPSKARPKPLPLARRTNKTDMDSSFMEIKTPKRLDFSFDISPARDLNPWSRSASARHARSVSSPTPASPKYGISEPMPLSGYEFGPSSSYPALPLEESLSTMAAGLNRKMSSSPPRIRNRPPPITLPRPVVNHRLPVLTANSPSMAQPEPHRGSVIVTPFVKPRAAPAPGVLKDYIPAVPPIPLEHITYRPPASTTVGSGSTNGPRLRDGKGLVPRSEQREETSTRDLISFFEPVTPVERTGPMYGSGVESGAAGGTRGKGWLKRAMKPLRS